METYFGCQQPRHRVAQCPLKAANSAPTQSIASNKPAASGTGHTAPQNSGPPRRNALNFGQGRVNHVNAEEIQAAPNVVYGEFLATVLFDYSTSHSSVSACFVYRNSLRTVLLPTPLLI
jgi:hypothetical protein